MSSDIEVIAESNRVEELFSPYREALGDDFLGYRNHVYRVLTYAMHFLDQDDAEAMAGRFAEYSGARDSASDHEKVPGASSQTLQGRVQVGIRHVPGASATGSVRP